MGLENLLTRLQPKNVTPVTPCNPPGVTGRQALIPVVTRVTPVTPQKTIVEVKNEKREEPKQQTIDSLTVPPQDAPEDTAGLSDANSSLASKETALTSANAEILNRLEAVAILAVQFAGKLKDFSPEQQRIADLLDRAHEIEHAEPLDTVKLAAAIGEIETAMKPEPKKTDGKRPLDDQTEYRNERAAILAFSANLPSDEAEYRAILERPCMCGGRKFWVSIFDVIICGRCHPPTQDSFVKRWI